MIDPGTIQELLNKEPFEPFRIRMNDGQHYDVTIPSLVVPMESTLFLAMPKRDRFKLLSYQNMSSIESPLQAA
jgi:hypothetical protein